MSESYDQALVNYQKAIALNKDNEGGNNDRLQHVLGRIKLKMSKK